MGSSAGEIGAPILAKDRYTQVIFCEWLINEILIDGFILGFASG